MLIDQSPARRRIRRVPAILVVLGVACVVLTGCGRGPSQVGAAAIVGSEAVSLADVQARINAVLRRPEVMANLTGQDNAPARIARFVVTEQVQHVLLAEAARRDRIAVSDQQVNAELAKPDTATTLADTKLVFGPAEQRDAVRDELIAEALTEKYLARLVVTLDATTATSRDEAQRKARLLTAGPQQADAVLTADGPNAQRDVRLRAAEMTQSAALILFGGTPAGQAVATKVESSPEVWVVVRVTQRSTDGPPQGDPGATSVAQLGQQTADEIGRRFTQPVAEELGVRINPRYGTWDPLYLGVVPPGQDTSLVLTSSSG